ncbi:MAG: D-alanyl-D-alanine carboxypeptidase [Bacteroidales bacterium]|nr:D-alanyl-D-alanine carboxypeptidase [Bacteroidales bacterium]
MRTAVKIIAALLLCLSGTLAQARVTTTTQKLISKYIGKEPLRSGIVGILAIRENGDTLASLNKQVKLVPASNVKLITTGLALTRLGPEYRFLTTLAYNGEIRDSVLVGDLYIVGGGDPTTGSASSCAEPVEATFGAFRAMLEYAGIRRIDGRIVADQRCFKRPAQSPAWQYEDLGFNYGAGPEGLNFFENAQNFVVVPSTPGLPPTIRPVYPDTPWMSWTISATTSEVRTQNTLYYINSASGPWGEFFGAFPADRNNYKFQASNRFGPWTYAYYFYNYLEGNGIEATGGYADISPRGFVRSDLLYSDIGDKAHPQDSLTVLGSRLSPTLASIITDTNTESDNFYAETVFAAIGLDMRGSTDREESAAAEESLLKGMGLNPLNSCTLVDGSGLSRKNYVSAEFFVRFLRKMLAGKARRPFIDSLPIPGNKGTLKYRMKGVPEETRTRIRMKSGSMNGVRCFSGYILPAPGEDKDRTVTFSILTNNIPGQSSTVYAILDELILSLADEP